MERIELMVFDHETTNRSDFKDTNMLEASQVIEKVKSSSTSEPLGAIRELQRASKQEEKCSAVSIFVFKIGLGLLQTVFEFKSHQYLLRN